MKRFVYPLLLLLGIQAPLLAGGNAVEEQAELPGWEVFEGLDENMARGMAIDLCLREGSPTTYQYYYALSATNTGGGEFTFVGTLSSIDLPVIWSVTGTYSKSSGSLMFTAVNPAPDGCVFYAGSFSSVGSQSGKTFSGTWSNDCGAAGSWSGVGTKGTCPTLRMAPDATRFGGGAMLRQSAVSPTAKLFPNPAAHHMQLDLSAYAGQDVHVELVDMSGRTLMVLNNGAAPATLRAELNQQAPGLYLVRIQHAKGVETLPLQVVR